MFDGSEDIQSIANNAFLKLEEARREYINTFTSRGYEWVSGGLYPEDEWNLWVHKDFMNIAEECEKHTCYKFLSQLKDKLGVEELSETVTLPNYIYYTQEV